MASAQRVRLIAKSIMKAGADVKVLCITAVDQKNDLLNKKPSGNFDGIQFEYTTGKTFKADGFFERRWVEFNGVVIALWRIWKLWKNGHQNIRLFLYAFSQEPNLSRFVITLTANLLRIPVVLELCERPWSLGDRTNNVFRNLPSLSGISGVIVISKFLENWCRQEARAQKRKLQILRIPILVDFSENSLSATKLTKRPSVLLASSQEYDGTVGFVLQAMQLVWEKMPDCALVITGSMKHQQRVNEFWANMNQKKSKVVVTGYIPREELFIRYRSSWALLIPLFDDVHSIARFPTKIGEYLSTARPIVTTNFGEISSFFVDGQNAFVAQEDTAEAFGRKILEALLSSNKAMLVGRNGLNTCKNYFDYSKYSDVLLDFFLRLGDANGY